MRLAMAHFENTADNIFVTLESVPSKIFYTIEVCKTLEVEFPKNFQRISTFFSNFNKLLPTYKCFEFSIVLFMVNCSDH